MATGYADAPNGVAGEREALAQPAAHPPTAEGSFRQQVAAFEHRLLSEALRTSHGNQSEAARRLGMSRVTFIDRMKKHGL